METGLGEFAGALGGGADGFDTGRAEGAGFQRGESGDGGAAGTGDLIAEHGGMLTGLKDERGGSGDGLRGEFQGLFFAKSFGESAVGEGLDEGENIGGTAAAEAGDGVQEGLGDESDRSHGAEERLGGGGIGWSRGAAGGIGGGALTDEGGRIGHDADDAVVTGGGFHGLQGDAGGDGDEELAFRDGLQGGDEREDAGGFHAEEDGIGGADGGRGVRCGAETGNGGQGGLEGGSVGIEDRDGVGGEQLAGDDALEEGGAHFSGAEASEGGGGGRWRDVHDEKEVLPDGRGRRSVENGFTGTFGVGGDGGVFVARVLGLEGRAARGEYQGTAAGFCAGGLFVFFHGNLDGLGDRGGVDGGGFSGAGMRGKQRTVLAKRQMRAGGRGRAKGEGIAVARRSHGEGSQERQGPRAMGFRLFAGMGFL